MRADVNLSVREVGAEKFGTRTEMKNLNSFKAIARAIEGERERQIELIEEGKKVIQETRRWDDNKEYSYAMRSKEDAQDYRYFPDPDLVPVVISDEWIAESEGSHSRNCVRRKWPVIRRSSRFRQYDAEILTSSKHMADIFEARRWQLCSKPKEVSNWLMVETMRLLKEHEHGSGGDPFLTEAPGRADQTGRCREPSTVLWRRRYLKRFLQNDVDPEQYVEEKGLKVVNDEGALRKAIQEDH